MLKIIFFLLFTIFHTNAVSGLIILEPNKAKLYFEVNSVWGGIEFTSLRDGSTFDDINSLPVWETNPNLTGLERSGPHEYWVWDYGWTDNILVRSSDRVGSSFVSAATIWDGDSVRPNNQNHFNNLKLSLYTNESIALKIDFEDGNGSESIFWVPDSFNDNVFTFGSRDLNLLALSWTNTFRYSSNPKVVGEPPFGFGILAIFIRRKK